MGELSVWTKTYLGLVAFSLAGSLFSRLGGLDPGPIAPVAAVATLVAGVGAVGGAHRRQGGRTAALPAVLALGAAVEVLGLATGFPFGRYAYTDRWWPTVILPGELRYPLSLPLAWLLVVTASYLTVSRVAKRGGAALLAGLLAASVDLAMEPTMTGRLHYWRWLEPGPLPGGAPLANFAGWFGASCLAAFLLTGGTRSEAGPDGPAVLLGHLCLIVGLGAI